MLIRFVISIIFSFSLAISYATPDSIYKGAELFAPLIRDRLDWDYSTEMFCPTENAECCCALQLTDDTFWKSQKNSFFSNDWCIGDSVIIERGINPDENDFWLINLVTSSRQQIFPVSLSQIEAENKDSNRYYILPLLDKPCLFRFDFQLDRIQVGARNTLLEFEPVVDNFLSNLEWTRGATVHIQGSGHPDYPYWIVNSSEKRRDDGLWIPAVLAKLNPILSREMYP